MYELNDDTLVTVSVGGYGLFKPVAGTWAFVEIHMMEDESKTVAQDLVSTGVSVRKFSGVKVSFVIKKPVISKGK